MKAYLTFQLENQNNEKIIIIDTKVSLKRFIDKVKPNLCSYYQIENCSLMIEEEGNQKRNIIPLSNKQLKDEIHSDACVFYVKPIESTCLCHRCKNHYAYNNIHSYYGCEHVYCRGCCKKFAERNIEKCKRCPAWATTMATTTMTTERAHLSLASAFPVATTSSRGMATTARATTASAFPVATAMPTRAKEECPICLDAKGYAPTSLNRFGCLHYVCSSCTTMSFSRNQTRCPLCRSSS